MSPSTKKALRTGYQAVLALILIVPVVVSALPAGAQVAAIVAAVATVTKIVNALEDAGLIPAWLRDPAADEVAADIVALDVAPTEEIVVEPVVAPAHTTGGFTVKARTR